jgi:hypothetical protein
MEIGIGHDAKNNLKIKNLKEETNDICDKKLHKYLKLD